MNNHTIKKARKKRGLTQKDLAQKLDVSRNIVIKIEKGKRELRMSEAGELSDLLGIKVEALVEGRLPEFDKYKEMILYTLACVADMDAGDDQVPKTKLAKILYLADFTWFYHELESMSGMSYRKIDYGPVPDEFFRALEDLEHEKLIDITITETEDERKAHLINLTEGGKQVTYNELRDKEQGLIREIVVKWEPKSTSDIVSFTHQQLPYKLAADGEIISYALIGQEQEQNLY